MSSQPDPVVRSKVRDLLLSAPAFRNLPPDQQQQVVHHTVEVADYLARPDGLDPQQVNFPDFVSQLIKGVFDAIVQSSIEQMEAYGQLVAKVAKTLNQFRDENASPNVGRDHLVDQFPDLFRIDVDTDDDGAPTPRVRLKDGVDESAALKRVNSSLPIEGGPVSSLDDDTVEEKLVPAARTQLATNRQQLLATMVLSGINRIVVTDAVTGEGEYESSKEGAERTPSPFYS